MTVTPIGSHPLPGESLLDAISRRKRELRPLDPAETARFREAQRDALRAEGAAAATDEAADRAYAEWLPLLSRSKVPGYVAAAIPGWARDRYERETS